MMNIALAARKQLQSLTRFVTGVTASAPAYKAVDALGNKEWVADVYLGPLQQESINIVRDVIIASTARQTIAKARLPVLLDRSKQGKYTIIGRADTMPAGAQMPDGSVLEPTYNRIEYNLAGLGTTFIADLTYVDEKWGEKVWGDGMPWKDARAFDAFGNQVLGKDLDQTTIPPQLSLTPIVVTTTRHVLLTKRGWGGPDPLRWGVDRWGEPLQKLVENVT